MKKKKKNLKFKFQVFYKALTLVILSNSREFLTIFFDYASIINLLNKIRINNILRLFRNININNAYIEDAYILYTHIHDFEIK